MAAIATAVAAYQAKRAAQISEKVSKDSEASSQLEIFLKFSNDYDRIKENFRNWVSYQSFNEGSVSLQQEQFESAFKMLKLFERELFLWRKRLIHDQLWFEVFQPKVIKFINMHATKHVWSKKEDFKDFDFSEDFENYVKQNMKA